MPPASVHGTYDERGELGAARRGIALHRGGDAANELARVPGSDAHGRGIRTSGASRASTRRVLKHGVDITAAPVPVHPAAHYAMGGVRTDVDGRNDTASGSSPRARLPAPACMAQTGWRAIRCWKAWCLAPAPDGPCGRSTEPRHAGRCRTARAAPEHIRRRSSRDCVGILRDRA